MALFQISEINNNNNKMVTFLYHTYRVI